MTQVGGTGWLMPSDSKTARPCHQSNSSQLTSESFLDHQLDSDVHSHVSRGFERFRFFNCSSLTSARQHGRWVQRVLRSWIIPFKAAVEYSRARDFLEEIIPMRCVVWR